MELRGLAYIRTQNVHAKISITVFGLSKIISGHFKEKGKFFILAVYGCIRQRKEVVFVLFVCIFLWFVCLYEHTLTQFSEGVSRGSRRKW